MMVHEAITLKLSAWNALSLPILQHDDDVDMAVL
jgi:hypothetical protein